MHTGQTYCLRRNQHLQDDIFLCFMALSSSWPWHHQDRMAVTQSLNYNSIVCSCPNKPSNLPPQSISFQCSTFMIELFATSAIRAKASKYATPQTKSYVNFFLKSLWADSSRIKLFKVLLQKFFSVKLCRHLIYITVSLPSSLVVNVKMVDRTVVSYPGQVWWHCAHGDLLLIYWQCHSTSCALRQCSL